MDFLTMIAQQPGTPLIVAGALGGVARWLFVILIDKKMAISQGLGTIVLGAILGYYVSPNFEGLTNLMFSSFTADPSRLPSFSAFATGVGGVGVVGFIIDWWTNRIKKPNPEPGVDPTPTPGDK